ncbi:MAG: [protein-PII] uridylyltransferase, partial [Ignavibacteria bacterium]
MHQTSSIKKEFLKKRDDLFRNNTKQKDSLKFSLDLSLLIEEYIRTLAAGSEYNFCLASAGSFSRRELSPCSDIDLMFISDAVEKNQRDISLLVTKFWDNGIEVSHTVRDFSDIKKYAGTDLHTFTQFFETRFLLGSEKIYKRWNEEIFSAVSGKVKVRLLDDMIEDIQNRYEKYGDSPKVLEPNVKLSAGGLRDFQSIEWMFMIQNKTLLNKQEEATQAEIFIDLLREKEYTSPSECNHLLESYKLILGVRNLLHLHSHQKNDRFEFNAQQRISRTYDHKKDPLQMFMKEYFKAANIINRFSKSMIKKFQEDITNPIPDSLGIDLDENFVLKRKKITYRGTGNPSLSDIIRAFYYRTLYGAFFDE